MASKRAERRRSCERKARHVSAAKAWVQAALGMDKHPGTHLHVYRCQFCGGYHVGHAPQMAESRRA